MEERLHLEEFSIKKNNGFSVSAVRAVPVQPEGIVIAIHGFTSSKESSTYRRLLKQLPAAGLGVLCIDLPGHGTHESAEETLRIPAALDSIEAAEAWAVENYPGCPVFYFASSFGAYLTGLYISTRDHAGRKAFWRSAAVNMPDLFRIENPTEKERQQLADLETKGYFDTDMDLDGRSVRITREFCEELFQNDLFQVFDADHFGEHSIAMAHGREDQVISPAAAERFAERFQIPVTWFPGEGHSLSNDAKTPEMVIDLAASLYKVP